MRYYRICPNCGEGRVARNVTDDSLYCKCSENSTINDELLVDKLKEQLNIAKNALTEIDSSRYGLQFRRDRNPDIARKALTEIEGDITSEVNQEFNNLQDENRRLRNTLKMNREVCDRYSNALVEIIDLSSSYPIINNIAQKVLLGLDIEGNCPVGAEGVYGLTKEEIEENSNELNRRVK